MTTGTGGQQILMDPKMGVIAEEEDGIQVQFYNSLCPSACSSYCPSFYQLVTYIKEKKS